MSDERVCPFMGCPRETFSMDPLEGCTECKGVGYHHSIPNPAWKPKEKESTLDNGTLVYLKDELDDDRYPIGTKLRTGQIGFVTGQRNVPNNQHPEHWVWVTWYAGLNAQEAAQCHRTTELGVVKKHAPFAE